ncbi:MAG: glycoside hydrolase domain-containing protein [Sphingobacterium sp.]
MKISSSNFSGMLLSGLLLLATSGCVHQTPHSKSTQSELADPTADTLADWSGVNKGLHASYATVDKRFAKSLVPDIRESKKHGVRGWKGERVGTQILLWTSELVSDVQVKVSEFAQTDGDKLAGDIASARFVRYVMTDEYGDGCGPRKNGDFPASLSADMLDSVQALDMEANKVRPVWVTVHIPRDAKPGKYSSKIAITSQGKVLDELDFTLEVVDQTLPAVSKWGFHLDQWQHPAAVARVHGVELWSDAHFEALKPVMKMLADAGQKVITTTLNKDPWNVQTYDPYDDMITWTKKSDGSWKYNYAIFDQWVELMLDLGVNKMINCYSIIPWNNEIHYHDEASDSLVTVAAKPGTPIFNEVWTTFLIYFVANLDSKDWINITNIAIDERSSEEMAAAFSLLKEISPKLGVSYADNHKTYQRYPDSEDISISAAHPFSPEDLKDRKARGLNTTFYICCTDVFPNQFTFSPPAESTYLGWYTEANNFNGMLRWAYNSWVEDAAVDSRFRAFPAGDTFVVYPGARSSIRFERMVEGIQDYEKIQIVKTKLRLQGDLNGLASLQTAIQKLGTVDPKPTWNNDLNEAKDILHELSVKLATN